MYCSCHSYLTRSRDSLAQRSFWLRQIAIVGESCHKFFGTGSKRFSERSIVSSDLSQQEKNRIGYDWLNYNGSLQAAEPKQIYRSGGRGLHLAAPL
jgi:hypothetical protein